MARRWTSAQITRRCAILARLRQVKVVTIAGLRRYLAGRKHIYVTEDTVGRDLRAMEKAGTVVRGPSTVGHVLGGGRRIMCTGWSIGPEM